MSSRLWSYIRRPRLHLYFDPASTGNLVIELAELPKDGHGAAHGAGQAPG